MWTCPALCRMRSAGPGRIAGVRGLGYGAQMKSRVSKIIGAVLLLLASSGALRASKEAPPSGAPGSPEGSQSETAQQSGSQPPPKDEFAQMDGDGDGRISAAEYAASPQSAIDRIAAGKRQGPAGITGGFSLANNEGQPDRSRFFKKLDADGDGYLSRSEVNAAGRQSGDAPKR